MKKLFNLFHKKKNMGGPTGFQVRFYINGALVTESFTGLGQLLKYEFPMDVKISKDTFIYGYKIEPLTERIKKS